MGSGAFLVAVCRLLAELLVKAWHVHNVVPKDIPPDEDEILHARRIVAQRCLYGVDKNPMAVDLAKLSLWLATLAKDHPFTFLDHALRHGDSLVGLSKKQIEAFHWKPEQQRDFARNIIEDRISRATTYRREIREAAEATLESLLSQKLALADEALNPLRFYGDLVIAVFFAGSNDRQRKTLLDQSAEQLSAYLHNPHRLELRKPLQEAWRQLTEGEKSIHPFHWEIEFPEVFDRENPGFDGFLGNPPFAGKNTLAAGHADGYPDWLKTIHAESHGNSDLVAHFFRSAFNLLRLGGALGLIATNTIGQGDTRSTGLRWICTHGGMIFAATRRKKWLGQAAVTVSVVHIHRGAIYGPYRLDERDVPLITAYLFHAGGNENPTVLKVNANKSFIGSYVLGMGFTFDDTDKKGVASPIAEMHRLIAKNKANADLIFSYVGGEEINESPTHAHHRYVINFGCMSEQESRGWPDLMAVVEKQVKGTRASHSTALWWQFERPRGELYKTIEPLHRVIVCSLISKYYSFTFLPNRMVFSHGVVVIADQSDAMLCMVQSQLHQTWAYFNGATFERP